MLELSDRRPVEAPLDGTLITRGAFQAELKYRMCSFCVMDTTDPEIQFDEHGRCNHCRTALLRTQVAHRARDAEQQSLLSAVDSIQRRGHRRPYDCILGLSGGLDSSFLAMRAVDWGLRPLVLHVDTGWNSVAAVSNVHRLLTGLNLELKTVVIRWKAMRGLQVSFMKSGLANQDTPQDHAIFATLYKVAEDVGIPTVLEGSNWTTESILPRQWGYTAMDGRHIRAVHSQFGTSNIQDIATISRLDDLRIHHLSRNLRLVNLLNQVPYSPRSAAEELEQRYGWVPYGAKHTESVWTSYFQKILLPYRYGYDKRKAHLSSRIVSGQITRVDALATLGEPLVDAEQSATTRHHIARKLGITVDDLIAYENLPLAHYTDFPNDEWKVTLVRNLYRALTLKTGR